MLSEGNIDCNSISNTGWLKLKYPGLERSSEIIFGRNDSTFRGCTFQTLEEKIDAMKFLVTNITDRRKRGTVVSNTTDRRKCGV